MKKKLRVVQCVGGGACAEIVFAYPIFRSVEEGLAWIRAVLDPYCTGAYGITEEI